MNPFIKDFYCWARSEHARALNASILSAGASVADDGDENASRASSRYRFVLEGEEDRLDFTTAM